MISKEDRIHGAIEKLKEAHPELGKMQLNWLQRIEDYYFLISVSVLLETAVLIYFILSTGTPRIYEKTFLYFVTVSTAWSTGILRSFSTNISGDCPSVAPASDQTKSANESFS